MRAILAAAARGEEESLQHHADTRVRLPIALWIRPARLFYGSTDGKYPRPRQTTSASASGSPNVGNSVDVQLNDLTHHRGVLVKATDDMVVLVSKGWLGTHRKVFDRATVLAIAILKR